MRDNSYEEEAPMDLTAVYRGNMDDINRYLTNEVGRDMDFGTEQLGELLNAVNTDDFWDGLLEELPDNDLLQDNDSGEDSSGESVIVRESSTPPVDSHTSVASNDEIGHFLKRREFWNELSSMDKEVKNVLPCSTIEPIVEAPKQPNEVPAASVPAATKSIPAQSDSDLSRKFATRSPSPPTSYDSLRTRSRTTTIDKPGSDKIMSAKKDLMLNESSLERQLAHEIDQSMASSASYHPILGILFAVFVAILVVFLTRPSERLPSFFRVLWLIVFALNLIAMSVPGRLDRVLATDMHVKPWTSLFEAAPWGFALWAGIIALEVLLVGYVALVGIPVDIFQGLTPYWIMGNLLQSVWCITYRPRFKSQLWIPALILAIAMVVFAKAHQEITFHLATSSFTNPTTKIVLYLVRIPFAMHGTWLAVAALLNLNSYVTIAGATKGNQLAVACCSAYFITAVGLFGATGRSDPVISITASWALESICSRSTEKMRMPRNFVGPEAYESLVITEGMLANLMKCVSLGVIVAPFFPASSFPSVP